MDDRPLTYMHRPKPYSAELVLSLDGAHFTAERGKSRQTFPLGAIERVRLSFTPRNTARLAFTCMVRSKDGRSVTFDNLSWKSLIETERLDRDYRGFIAELIARAAAANGAIILEAGISPFRHRMMMIFGAAMMIALAVAAYVGAREGSLLVLAFAAGLAAYLGFWLRSYLGRNRPRRFGAKALPDGVLPDPG